MGEGGEGVKWEREERKGMKEGFEEMRKVKDVSRKEGRNEGRKEGKSK